MGVRYIVGKVYYAMICVVAFADPHDLGALRRTRSTTIAVSLVSSNISVLVCSGALKEISRIVVT